MVEGVVLVVDFVQGPMTQTKFVLRKALALPHVKPIVVVNKVDRPSGRSQAEIDNEIFDLFLSLNASDEQMEYVTIYASAKQGWAAYTFADSQVVGVKNAIYLLFFTPNTVKKGRVLTPLDSQDPAKREKIDIVLQTIVEQIKPPMIVEKPDAGFAMLVTTIDNVPGGLGLTSTGKIYSGTTLTI